MKWFIQLFSGEQSKFYKFNITNNKYTANIYEKLIFF